MPELPVRRYPAHQPIHLRDGRPCILFVTVCSLGRKPVLAKPDVHQLLVTCWLASDHWLVGRYAVMPDHIHMFCAPASEDGTDVGGWVAYWKSLASREWPRQNERPLWQTGCWDRQLRSGESYDARWEYVRNNPVRHGLVRSAEDWPYAGELEILEW